MSSERTQLIELLRRYSYFEGEFRLSSGRSSTYLIDVKRTALHPQGGRLIGRAMLSAARLAWPDAVAVGGLTLGADPLAISIAQASLDDGGPPLHAFIVRKKSKSHGTSRLIEASGGLADGAKVVVLEDVVTTGGSAFAAVEAVRLAGHSVCGVLALVDRREGGRERFAAEGLAFEAVFEVTDLKTDEN